MHGGLGHFFRVDCTRDRKNISVRNKIDRFVAVGINELSKLQNCLDETFI